MLSEDDESVTLDDTAPSRNTFDKEEQPLVDYDTNGERESHHEKRVNSVCLVAITDDERLIATFCTGQLQRLIAAEHRRNLPLEPGTLKEALTGPHKEEWRKAIEAEYNALIDRNTWELVELSPGRRAIGVKWVLKIKTNPKGELEKFKARLVAKGYAKKKGVDYDDTTHR